MVTILLVEDEELSRISSARLINAICPKDLRLVLIEACNGKEAVQYARKHSPDIILMDIILPAMNGLEALEAILAETPDVSAYLLTAHDSFGYAKKAIEIGVKGYILKPPKAEDIQAVFDRYLSSGHSDPGSAAEAAGLGVVRRPELKKDTADEGIHFKYPYEEEDAFINDLKQHNIEHAYISGEAVLEQILNHRNNQLLMKEYIIEFFVVFKRALVDFGCAPKDMINSIEMMDIYELDNHAQICRWAYEHQRVLLEPCRKRSTINELHKHNVLNSIDQNLAEVTIESLAKQEGVSKSYISRAFTDWTHETFTSYLISKRLSKAKELLKETQLKIEQVSVMVGYTDVNYFCRLFKDKVGVSPSHYRGYKR